MAGNSVWTITAFVLTILVIFSYLFGEKYPPFKAVSYLLIGVAAGYAAIVVIYQVLYPRLLVPFLFPALGYSRIIALVPLVLSALLLLKIFPGTSRFGNIASGIMVGAAAGVIIGGAILGTVFAQSKAAILLFDPELGVQPGRLLDALFMLFGTISTLLYFQFGGKQRGGRSTEKTGLIKVLSGFGKLFIAITLGALFAGVISAAISALAERLSFLSQVIRLWIR